MKPTTPEGWQELGICHARQLPDGRWIGLINMIFTTGLCVDLDDVGYAGRYCYASAVDAIVACAEYTGDGDPIGQWVKYKGEGGERMNPLFK